MERRSASLNFTLRIKATLLHKLLQRVAERAYKAGFEDAGKPRADEDLSRVQIDPSLLRKFQ